MFVDPFGGPLPDTGPTVIVGSGPAGLTLALELERLGQPSLVLEAGSDHYTGESQDHYLGEVVGDPYFDLSVARLRMFGGSSNHWGGWVRPLDPQNFRPRAGRPMTGWPISAEDLAPFLSPASDILEVRETWTRPVTRYLDEVDFSRTPPVSFSDKYGAHIAASSRVALALDTAVVSVEARGGRVRGVTIRRGRRERFVPAGRVVLACGGIENSRLLLWSNHRSSEPVVARPDTLGRYFMEHPTFSVGEAILRGALRDRLEHAGILFFAPSAEALDTFATMAANIRLFPAWKAGLRDDFVCAPARLAPGAVRDTYLAVDCRAAIDMSWEQDPSAENRVELSDETDAFGIPLTRLYWAKSETDYTTAKKALEIFGTALLESGQGIARAHDYVRAGRGYPEDAELAGYHHMGGTRMAADPAQGIVDADLKVFGMDNLYIAGSSVFPSCGHANPTLTIVQLSLRLAEHLARRG